MKKQWLFPAAIFIAVAPWVVFSLQRTLNRIDWSCQSSYEINRVFPGNMIRAFARVSSHYHADGAGVMRFTGTLLQEQAGKPDIKTTLHRATEFEHSTLGSFLRITTSKATSFMDDNTPDELAGKYAYMGFNPGYVEYFQIMRIGSDAIASGFAGLPRIYCLPPAAKNAVK